MRIYLFIALFSVTAGRVFAFDTELNPDRLPSFGFDVIGGDESGIERGGIDGAEISSGYVGLKTEAKYPLTNTMTLHLAGETIKTNDSFQYSQEHRFEAGFNIYFGE